MGECPNCGEDAVGQNAVLLLTRHTLELRPAVECECGQVWVDEDLSDNVGGETLHDLLDMLELEKRIARLETELGLPQEIDDPTWEE